MNRTLVAQAYLPSALPTARQREYQDWAMGIFFHCSGSMSTSKRLTPSAAPPTVLTSPARQPLRAR